jgi:hypothetical protein
MLSDGLVLLTEEASVLQLLLWKENFGCVGCLEIESKESVITWVNCFSTFGVLGGCGKVAIFWFKGLHYGISPKYPPLYKRSTVLEASLDALFTIPLYILSQGSDIHILPTVD